MIKNGARPTKIDHRDYDFHKTFGSVAPASFPAEYLCDAGVTMPDQNQQNNFFNPPVPALFDGCTDYAQSEIATDLSNGTVIRNPEDLDKLTNANALGGFDIRQSITIAKNQLGWFSAFFNIRAISPLDFFDAFRLAQLSGAPEKRSITFGTPWFPSWEAACNPSVNPSGVMPMPTALELSSIKQNINSFSWHNSKLDGWTTKNGTPLYRDKSWQGNAVGDKGFVYFPREVINTVMQITGTVGFTATQMGLTGTPQTINVTVVQWIVSFMRNLLGYQY